MLRTFFKAATLALATLALSLPAMAQGFIRDAEIEAILREYTDPILEAAGLIPEDVGLFLIGDPSLNAFVAGGQRIHLNTGLIIRTETPGQLKGVIAHETGHISGAHGARRAADFAKSARSGYVSIGLGIIALAAGAPELGAALIANSQQLTALSFYTHTRAQESSADQAAVTFLERTGQSPAGLVEFFEEFRYQEVLSQARRFEYFRTHPLASDRIRSLRARAEETGLMDVPATDRELAQMAIMHAKLIGFLEPPVVVYQRYPETDTSEPARYARAISAMQSVDLGKAIKEIDQLLEINPENPYYHELKGQILFEFGRIEDSIEPNRRAVELAPNQPLLMISYARSIIARGHDGDIAQGETLLRQSLIAEPDNAFAWSELAKALDKQGRRYEAELATAERSFHIGDVVGANTFAQRAIQGLEPSTPLMRRARDIAAVTDSRLEENRRYYRGR